MLHKNLNYFIFIILNRDEERENLSANERFENGSVFRSISYAESS